MIAVGGPSDRLDFAVRMGASHTVPLDMNAAERAAEIRSLTGGRGADIVIEAAGPADAVSDALEMVRDGGRVVVSGQYTDSGNVSINPHSQINRKHVELRGCWGSDYSHFHRAVQIASQFGNQVPWSDMVSRRFSLDETGSALDAVASRAFVKAIITPNDAPFM